MAIMQQTLGDKMLTCYCDGLHQEFNSVGTYAYIVSEHGSLIYQYSGVVTEVCSAMTMEYCGLERLLSWLYKHDYSSLPIKINTDCETMVLQVQNKAKITKSAEYYYEYCRAKELYKKFIDCNISWISRKKNRNADKLCTLAYKRYVSALINYDLGKNKQLPITERHKV